METESQTDEMGRDSKKGTEETVRILLLQSKQFLLVKFPFFLSDWSSWSHKITFGEKIAYL